MELLFVRQFTPLLGVLILLLCLGWCAGVVSVFPRLRRPASRLAFMAIVPAAFFFTLTTPNLFRVLEPHASIISALSALCSIVIWTLGALGALSAINRWRPRSGGASPAPGDRPPDAPDPERRRLMQLGAASAAGLIPGGVYGGGYFLPEPLNVTRVPLRPDQHRLPLTRPIKTLFFSDLHAGFFLHSDTLKQLIDAADAQQPDLILFGGDAVTRSHREIGLLEPTFRALLRRAPVVAVLGNHDCFEGPGRVAGAMRGWGVTVLRDQAHAFNGELTLFGSRDLMREQVDASPLEGLEKPALVLSHNPELALHLSGRARRNAALVLSGHTHGGQIVLPGIGPVAIQPHPALTSGWVELPGKPPALITRGVGFVALPVRIGCPAQVMAIEFRV